MKKQKYYLYLSDAETRLILHSLIHLKNHLVQQGRYIDIVDEIIVKVMDAPIKKFLPKLHTVQAAYSVKEYKRLRHCLWTQL